MTDLLDVSFVDVILNLLGHQAKDEIFEGDYPPETV